MKRRTGGHAGGQCWTKIMNTLHDMQRKLQQKYFVCHSVKPLITSCINPDIKIETK